MKPVIFSASTALNSHLRGIFDQPAKTCAEFSALPATPCSFYLVNITSMGKESYAWIEKLVAQAVPVAVCSDRPELGEMLECVRLGAKAYCNSFMQETHYRQMIKLVAEGQSWYPPQMMEQVFQVARQAVNEKDKSGLMADLTRREQDISLAICKGKSNREIAQQFAISEPTVKSHLTNIFKKLGLKDRVALVLYLGK